MSSLFYYGSVAAVAIYTSTVGSQPVFL